MDDHQRAMELLPASPPGPAVPQYPGNVPDQRLVCALCAFHVVDPERHIPPEVQMFASIERMTIVVINGQSVCLLHARYVISPPFSAALAALREDQPDV